MQTWGSPEAAERWRLGAARRAQSLGPITERMLDAACLRPGMRVLDIAAGTGETSLLAAQRVSPGGSVLAVDISASMLHVAAESAAAAGLANVEILASDASQIELPPRSFDAAISRLGLMFMTDLDRALRGVHDALKPGARLAAIVWSAIERNPYMGAPVDVVRAARGTLSPSLPIVRAFSLSEPAILEQALTSAGFREVNVERVVSERAFASVDEARVTLLTTSTNFEDLTNGLNDAERARLLDQVVERYGQFCRPDGACVMPGELLLASGEC